MFERFGKRRFLVLRSAERPIQTYKRPSKEALAIVLWERECRHAESFYDEAPEVRDGFREDAQYIIEHWGRP
jgi:hypothetical protein